VSTYAKKIFKKYMALKVTECKIIKVTFAHRALEIEVFVKNSKKNSLDCVS